MNTTPQTRPAGVDAALAACAMATADGHEPAQTADPRAIDVVREDGASGGARFYKGVRRGDGAERFRYPSVTTILSVWPKGLGFQRWLGDSKSHDAATQERDAAAGRGSRVHRAAEAMMRGEDARYHIESEEEQHRVEGFARWMREWKVEPVEVERTLVSHRHGYAGTFDLLAYVTDPKTGERFLCVVDLKTGKAVYNSYVVQLAAYEAARRETDGDGEPTKLAVLRLALDRKQGYQFKVFAEPLARYFSLFLAAYEIWKFENPKGLALAAAEDVPHVAPIPARVSEEGQAEEGEASS